MEIIMSGSTVQVGTQPDGGQSIVVIDDKSGTTVIVPLSKDAVAWLIETLTNPTPTKPDGG